MKDDDVLDKPRVDRERLKQLEDESQANFQKSAAASTDRKE